MLRRPAADSTDAQPAPLIAASFDPSGRTGEAILADALAPVAASITTADALRLRLRSAGPRRADRSRRMPARGGAVQSSRAVPSARRRRADGVAGPRRPRVSVMGSGGLCAAPRHLRDRPVGRGSPTRRVDDRPFRRSTVVRPPCRRASARRHQPARAAPHAPDGTRTGSDQGDHVAVGERFTGGRDVRSRHRAASWRSRRRDRGRRRLDAALVAARLPGAPARDHARAGPAAARLAGRGGAGPGPTC